MLRRKPLLTLAAVIVAGLLGTSAAYAQGGSTLGSSTSSSFTGGTSFSGGANFTGGTSFSGGTTFSGGTSFSGSSSFTGNQTFRGGFNGNSLATTSNSSGANQAFGASANASGISPSSAFSGYYVNPLAAGAPVVSSLSGFYAPIFSSGNQGGSSPFGGGNFGSQFGSSSPFGGNGSPTGTGSGTNTGTASNARRPSYTLAPDSSLMMPAGVAYGRAGPSQLQSEVTQVLARSTSLSPTRAIQVNVEGPMVVLRGTVASPHDRSLAEALVRLTPGVENVRNELQVPGMVPRTGPGP